MYQPWTAIQSSNVSLGGNLTHCLRSRPDCKVAWNNKRKKFSQNLTDYSEMYSINREQISKKFIKLLTMYQIKDSADNWSIYKIIAN